MSSIPPDIVPILQYAAPPTVGAFIGYLTNKIAIKMLFRPLKPWRVFGLRVPMTPGVIPSKREELADNMGKMVAEHLLTSTEIGKTLEQDAVKKQIYKTIEAEGEKLAHKDLGNLQSIIPEQFAPYYELGTQYISYKTTQGIIDYLKTPQFETVLDEQLNSIAGELLNSKLSQFISEDQQAQIINKLENSLANKLYNFLETDDFKNIVRNLINSRISELLLNQKSLDELFSDETKELFKGFVLTQTKPLLAGLSELVKDKNIRQKIIDGACGGVENFIASMGPMAAMVSNFVSIDMVNEKIEEYLDEKEDEIIEWFHSPEITTKLEKVLELQVTKLLSTPLVKLVSNIPPEKIEGLSDSVADYICEQFADKDLTYKLSHSLCKPLKGYLAQKPSIGNILSDTVGEDCVKSVVTVTKENCLNYLKSDSVSKMIRPMVDTLLSRLLQKKIGKLSGFINENMRISIYNSLQKTSLNVLKTETPHVTKALNLQHIVSSKINSLDLLKLEGLLLSIMEEQFKYINLFGALLGFILGCINLVFIALN